MNVNHLLGACVIALGVLVPMGAPIPAVAGGIAMAAVLIIGLSKLKNVESKKAKPGRK